MADDHYMTYLGALEQYGQINKKGMHIASKLKQHRPLKYWQGTVHVAANNSSTLGEGIGKDSGRPK